MKFSKISYLIVGVIIIMFYIFPFVLFTQYTHLGIDDICRTHSSAQNFFEEIFMWYNNINGRYISAVFSSFPVYDLPIYRWTLTIGMIFFFVVITYFINNLLQLFGFVSKTKSFIFSLIFIVLLLSQLPSLYEIFYWYASVNVYLYSFTFLLLLLMLLYKISLENKNKTILSALLIVLITGSTEMLIPLMNFILIILFVVTTVSAKKIPWNIIMLNIVCLGSSLIVVMAPGSEKRQSIFSESGQIIYSLKNSIETALKIIWNRFHDPVVWVFIILVFFMVLFQAKNIKKRPILLNPLILLLLSSIAFVSVIFVPFYALGFIDYGAGRIIDIIYFIFFILLLINSLNFFKFLHLKYDLKLFRKFQFLPFLMIIVFLITVTISNQNFKGMYEDFSSSSYIRYDDDFINRYELLKNTKKETIIIPTIKSTRIFTFNDFDSGDQCFIQHVRSNYNFRIKNIKIQPIVNKDGV